MLGRYLARQMVGPLMLALVALSGGAWATQLLRLGHHLLGGELGWSFWGGLLLFSAPSLLSFCLPFALSAAVLYTCARAAHSGELVGMRAAGATPLGLAGWPMLLVAGCAAAAWVLVAQAEPGALNRLSSALYRGAERRLIASTPGVFHRITPELTLYVGRRLPARPGELRGANALLSISHPPAVVVARRLRLTAEAGQRLLLELREGELQMSGSGVGPTDREVLRRMTFAELRQRIDVRGVLAQHFGFLRERIAGNPLRRGAAVVAQGITALAIGLCVPFGPTGLALAGLLAVSTVELAALAAQWMVPGWGGSLALLAMGLASLAWLASGSLGYPPRAR